ncbi:DUF3800 domain-containing protein [Pseudoduganella sp. R-32]|uniref:DUF3800 domain-containing protein n=1 Tax=Pseudoduganella sp. R-32 TaxID=3404061 RepID=UPI003CF1E3B7
MSREISIYCDESDKSGKHFSNFYGGALVESIHLGEVIARLEAKKLELNLGAEVKWQKISSAYAVKYMEFLDEVFALMAQGALKMRVMFTQNYYRPKNLTAEQRDNEFFLLYYQFVKHAFGLAHAGVEGGETALRMYFDQLPDTKEKCEAFKGYVLGLNQSKPFRDARMLIKKDQIAEIDSKEHVVLQSLDIVMGAIQFRLNDKHLEKPEGSRFRGKRTIAKEKVYKHVLNHIKNLHGYNFNIGVSTGTGGDATVHWSHHYRHWLFVPREYETDESFVKRK